MEAVVMVSPDLQRANVEDILGTDNPARGRRNANRGEKLTAQRKREVTKMLIMSRAIQPVTIVNFNPFPLKVNGGQLFQEEIPACPTDKDFVTRVMSEVRWSLKDHGAGHDNVDNYEPIAHLPAELALEYMREYNELQQFGGVFVYMGSKAPEDFKPGELVNIPVAGTEEDGSKTIDAEEVSFKDVFAKYKLQGERSIMRRLQQATSLHEHANTRNQVNDVDRSMAHRALRKGMISALPSWVMEIAQLDANLPDPCPLCGETPKAGAAVCKGCNGYVFDILKAYEAGGVEYGHNSFDRLDAEGWKKVNAIKAKRDKARAAAGGPATT